MPDTAGTRPTPKPCKGETLIQVITPLGLDVGSFCWPTTCLDDLKAINATPKGFYFTWNESNDPSKATVAHGAKI